MNNFRLVLDQINFFFLKKDHIRIVKRFFFQLTENYFIKFLPKSKNQRKFFFAHFLLSLLLLKIDNRHGLKDRPTINFFLFDQKFPNILIHAILKIV